MQCEVVPSTFAEDLPHADHNPASYVVATARQKTLEVASRLRGQGSAAPALIIGADTVRLPTHAVVWGSQCQRRCRPALRSQALAMSLHLSVRGVQQADCRSKWNEIVSTGNSCWGCLAGQHPKGVLGGWWLKSSSLICKTAACSIMQVVEVDGDILEKPADAEDAIRMLTR